GSGPSHSKLAAEHLGYEPALVLGNQLADLHLHFAARASMLGGGHRRAVRVPHVGARDLIAVALHEPVERKQSRRYRERGLLLAEVARCPSERLGITRRAARECQRVGVETRVLRSSEPLALLAGSSLDEVVEDLARGLVRVLLRHGAEGGEVGAGLVRAQAVTTVSLLDHPRRQEDLLTKAID